MRYASTTDVLPGTPIGRPVYNRRGDVLLAPGTPLTERYLTLLQARGTSAVIVDDEESRGIEIDDPLSERVRTLATGSIASLYEGTAAAIADVRQLPPEKTVAGLRSAGLRREIARLLPQQVLVDVVDEIFDEVFDLPLLSGLTAIKTYDTYTFCHSVEMAVAAIFLGVKVGLDKGSIKRLARGCIVHDIGKIFVREEVLNKVGRLDAEEQAEMQRHPTLGFELLQSVHEADVLVNHVAYQHHERQDGKGYPRGLAGNNMVDRAKLRSSKQILLNAEIASVADVYDALASARPYRQELPPEQVVAIMRGMAGTHLNRELVDAFLSSVPLFPAGMPVRLRGGNLEGYEGLVARVDPTNKDRPVIRVLRDSRGEPVAPFEIDLAKEPSIALTSTRGDARIP